MFQYLLYALSFAVFWGVAIFFVTYPTDVAENSNVKPKPKYGVFTRSIVGALFVFGSFWSIVNSWRPDYAFLDLDSIAAHSVGLGAVLTVIILYPGFLHRIECLGGNDIPFSFVFISIVGASLSSEVLLGSFNKDFDVEPGIEMELPILEAHIMSIRLPTRICSLTVFDWERERGGSRLIRVHGSMCQSAATGSELAFELHSGYFGYRWIDHLVVINKSAQIGP